MMYPEEFIHALARHDDAEFYLVGNELYMTSPDLRISFVDLDIMTLYSVRHVVEEGMLHGLTLTQELYEEQGLVHLPLDVKLILFYYYL
jgi:hypothetical protein